LLLTYVSITYSHTRPPRSHTSFSFNHTATTEIYTLSLHDALPISLMNRSWRSRSRVIPSRYGLPPESACRIRSSSLSRKQGSVKDRKSTRLNSSHVKISYAVFCLKKKKKKIYSKTHRSRKATTRER